MTGNCDCGRRWASLTECHCRVCHRHFTNIGAFDRHQPARGGCPDPTGLRDGDGNPVLALTHRAGGPIWVRWVSDDDRTAMRERIAASREANAGSRLAPRSAEQGEPVSQEG